MYPTIQTGRIITEHNNGGLGVLWIIGWIFTIGYLKLNFWRGVLSIIIWPYYLGISFSKINK
jgi:hypothetical protein